MFGAGRVVVVRMRGERTVLAEAGATVLPAVSEAGVFVLDDVVGSVSALAARLRVEPWVQSAEVRWAVAVAGGVRADDLGWAVVGEVTVLDLDGERVRYLLLDEGRPPR